jgi:serine/threonine-protein kinase
MPRRFVRGNLNRTKLPAILRAFYAGRKSGILHFSGRESPRRIFFEQGRIVRVESDAESDRFGEELVKSGRVQRAELDLALERAIHEGGSVGGALVKMERLTAEELKEAEIRRMSEIVHSLLALTEGEFRFEDRENPVGKEDAFEIPAEQVILDGVRRIADAALLRTLVGDLRATLRTTPSSPLPLFKVKMTPGERRLLEATRLQQTFSAEKLLSGSPLGEIDTLRALYALLSIGLLEAEGPPQAPPRDSIEREEPAAEVASEPAPKPEARVRAAPQAESIPQRLGRFELQRLLVRSSTGQVFRGRDPEIDRIVAIKVLDATAALTPAPLEKYLEIFHKEIERARQLYHPGIVGILETGRTEDGRPFLVTEYVQGTTLQDLLPSGPLAMKHALEFAAQIVDALAYAHSRGIVHRRVEPSNVLVTADGRVKIKDFGLPPLAGADRSASLPYLSPEETASGKIDARADVFSFGVVCYRMLTGALPFPEDSSTGVAQTPRPLDPPAPLEKYSSAFPPRLGEIVLRCLSRDPLERFADAGELKQALGFLQAPASAGEKVVPAPGPRPSPPKIAPSPPPARAATRPVSPPPAEPGTPAPVSPPPETRAPSPPEARIVVPVVEATPRVEPEFASTPTRPVAPAAATEAPDAPAPAAAKGAPGLRGRRRELPRRSPEPNPEKARPAAPPRRSRRRIWAFVAASSLAAVAGVAAAWTLIHREEPPWNELPAAPSGDVSVTPVPLSPPSEADLAALLAGPSDEALFADAKSALERGDLQGSRDILMELLERAPEFPGAQALLEQVEAERRKASERRRRVVEVKPEPRPVAADPSDAELFAEAENAFARGDLAVSRTKLDALLKINPGFSGAAELKERIEQRIWTTTLPRSFKARHNHRIGSCDGVLSLTFEGLSFRSNDHEWAWGYEALISMDRPDAVNFNVVTRDRDLMGILSNKRFRFRLEEVFSDVDWRFFEKAVRDQHPTPAPRN